jgi:crotonobetainyl-CoA:carnitine CoA-transferase CaiB-like acyl-CoA transferase
MFQPLAGKRVIDVTQVLAGPYCTYQLALMGAEVIKIELPGQGDWTRLGGNDPELSEAGYSLSFLTQNSNKKSVTLNLKLAEGVDTLKQLIATADLFVENFKPGTAARLGIGYDDLHSLNPRLVYASLSAYGQDGPLGHRPAYDHIIQGMAGIMHTTGTPETVPNKVGSPYVDYATGLMGAFAVVSALLERERTGEGQRVDVAMLDTAMLLMASLAVSTMATGQPPPPTGNEAFSGSPSSGTYQTADGLLMLAANNERQFQTLCRAIGRADLLEDPRFASPPERKENADALRAEFAALFRTRTAAEWEAFLDEAGVPGVRVRRMDEALTEPQLAARGLMQDVSLEGMPRTVALPSLGFKANGYTVGPNVSPPRLGQHTDEILGGLGLNLEALRARGVI